MNYFADKIKNRLKKEYHKLIEHRNEHRNRNLKFKKIDLNSQFYFYQSSLENRPLVVLFHEWNWGFKRYNALSDYCVKNDINYIQPKFRDYNFGSNGLLSGYAIEDIEKQIQYFVNNSKAVSSINLAGFSGGGYMALKFRCLSSIPVKNTVALSPVTDIVGWYNYLKHQKIVYYHDIMKFATGDLQKLRNINTKISPINLDVELDNRIILIHGHNDRIVPFEQSKRYFEKLAKRELNLTKLNLDIDSSISRNINGYDKEGNLEIYSHSGDHEDDSYLTFYLLQKYE